MNKNIYYRTVFRRSNPIKDFVLSFFLGLASWPRLLLEVFIRKNMGERYFSFATSVIMTVFLAFVPVFRTLAASMSSFGRSPDMWTILGKNLTWYLFLAAFIYFAWQRRKEVKRLPSVFDFERFTLSTGEVNPRFFTFKLNGKSFDVRTIETLIEPAFFFLIGLSLLILLQFVGVLIMISSVCYSLSYFAAYHNGDNLIMDTIDEIILSEEMVSTIVEGRDASQTRGTRIYGRVPADPKLRQKLADAFVVDDDAVIAF